MEKTPAVGDKTVEAVVGSDVGFPLGADDGLLDGYEQRFSIVHMHVHVQNSFKFLATAFDRIFSRPAAGE